MGLLSAARRGIRAFHGSPHDFDRFSLAHIGKGEGAQAYGHGLYFAENEGVARAYRDRLGVLPDGTRPYIGERSWRIGDEVVRELNLTPTQYNALREVQMYDNDIDRALDVNRRWLAQVGRTDDGLLREIEALRGRGPIVDHTPGRMYEVRINAEPGDFLDWDAPLSGQGQRIQEAFRGVPQAPDIPGQLAYYRMAGRQMQSPETSARLRDAGIPGIRYLDGNSRSAGEGSRNYVVFDDSLIEILRKYGLIGMLGGTGALGATQDGDSV